MLFNDKENDLVQHAQSLLKKAKAAKVAEAVAMLLQGPKRTIQEEAPIIVKNAQMSREATLLGIVAEVRHNTTEAPISVYNDHIVPMRPQLARMGIKWLTFNEWVRVG